LLVDDGSTLVLTTASSDPRTRALLRSAGAAVEVVADRDGRVDLDAGLARVRQLGMELVLVEGGATLVTGLLEQRLVDRMIVAIAPMILGSGIESIGDLGFRQVAEGLTLENRTLATVGEDLVLAGSVPASEQD
jgi:diaminohydroxyphosphoribosylaminopyrimidine deaminase/5-amino-6-(5-phosphoribosylamino)uracil reductase